jgi:hypothetical protein
MKSQNKPLSQAQVHDLWEIEPIDEITDEVRKVMKSLGLSTKEANRAMLRDSNKGDRKVEKS